MKYVAYCRKSTDEPDRQILSIEAQITEVKEFAQRENLEIVDFIVESRTARKPGRPEFQKVLQMIEMGKASGIVAWHPDRLARNSIDGGQLIYLLDTGKLLDLKFPSFWFDNTPQGKFMLNIAFGQSKYYVDNLSENVRRGIRQKLRRGEWPCKAPLGYFMDSAKKLQVDRKTGKYIKQVFEIAATGSFSFVNLQNFLFDHKVLSKHGSKIKIDTLKRLLTDPIYYGTMRIKGEFYQGVHKPLISKKLFDKVQEVLNHKCKNYRDNKTDFQFLGLATCGECGSAITAEKHHKLYKRKNIYVDYYYYRCSKKKKACHQSYLPSTTFENQLRQIIFNASLSPLAAKKFLEWANRDSQKDSLRIKSQIDTLNSAIFEINSKLDRLLDGYIDKTIDTLDYQRKKNELINKKIELEEKIEEIKINGSGWLEPFTEFVESALKAHKIARAKNNCADLLIGAKTVGSNYFLLDKKLTPKYQNDGFLALAANGGAACATSKNYNFPLLSGIMDSNHQPFGPHPNALANCANPRLAKQTYFIVIFCIFLSMIIRFGFYSHLLLD